MDPDVGSNFPSQKWDGLGDPVSKEEEQKSNESKANNGLTSYGIHRDHWSKIWWPYLHIICFQFTDSYTSIEKKEFHTALRSWTRTIPCLRCKQHAVLEIELVPPPIEFGRAAVWKWSVYFHNLINLRVGRPRLSLEEATRHWNEEIVGYYVRDRESALMKQKKSKEEASGKKTRAVVSWIALGAIIMLGAWFIHHRIRQKRMPSDSDDNPPRT